jgi:uncharacterized protein (TIGR02996 family)
MTPDEAFLEAIRDAPDDDTPRLVYADWLEEHGDPHGEFIRVQCALARLPQGDSHRWALAKRERQLWERHHTEWLKGHDPSRAGLKTFLRGFRFFIRHRVNDYPRRQQYVSRWAPVQSVALFPGGRTSPVSNEENGERLAACPSLAGWLNLGITNSWATPWLLPVLASPHLRQLRELHLQVALGFSGIRTLATLANLASLRKLSLQWAGAGDNGALALAESPHLKGLTSLKCSSMDLTDAGAQALAASPYLDNLEELDLGGNDAISSQARQLLYVRFGNRVQF